MNATQEQIEKLRTLQESYNQLADKVAELDGVAQEESVKDISSKLDNLNVDVDLSGVAKQGNNPEATNSKILEEVQNKLTPLEAVLTELNNGKQEMVDALATKNVQSSTDKTLSAIASDVRSIAQAPITIEGGEMYEKQLFGAATDQTNDYQQSDSPTWNLYKVMENLLNDGRFIQFGGIMLVEYGVNSDTVVLDMAGAGGVYLTSDGAMYDVDTTHTWDIKKDGKLNRWVAYIFKEEWKNVSLTHSNILSIHIGRKVGIITCTSSTQMNALVVTDGNMLKSFNSSGYAHKLVGNVIIKNIDEQSGILLYSHDGGSKEYPQSLYIKANKIVSPLIDWSTNVNQLIVYAIRIECEELNSAIYNSKQRVTLPLKELYITARKINTNLVGGHNIPVKFNPNFIIFKGVEEASITGTHYNDNEANISDGLKYIYIGYDTNDKTKSVSFTTTRFAYVEDVELQDGWCKPFTFNPVHGSYTLSNLTEENMINHILKRLKQDEEMCGSGVTITLGETNLAKLTSEEAVALLDSLTNIYGYTFA